MTPIVGIGLYSTVTDTAAPFIFGQEIAKNDIPSGQYPAINTSGLQAFVLRRWNNGSAKHVMFMGQVPVITNQEMVYEISATTTAPATGTLLTPAAIVARAPTAVISCGVFGSLNLASLLGAAPLDTFVATDKFIQCRYKGTIGTDPSLYGVFDVSLFKPSNRICVDMHVGNSALDGGEKILKTYMISMSVGGTVIENNGGVPYKHWPYTRFDAIGWIGGDPQIIPRPDTAYDRFATLLTPNYRDESPDEAQIMRWQAPTAAMNPFGSSFTAVNDYTPGNNCNYNPNMKDYGFQEHIGIYPNWVAQWVASRGDRRLWKTMIRNARAANSFAISAVDNVNKYPIKITDYPAWSFDGPGGSGGAPVSRSQDDAVAYQWEGAHHGEAAHMAYRKTCRRYFLETCQFNANAAYLSESAGHGSGLNRFWITQNRQRGWYRRSLAQIASIYPTHMQSIFGDTQAWLGNIIDAAWQQCCNTPNPTAWLGLEDAYSNRLFNSIDEVNSLAANGQIATGVGPFEHFFVAQSSGFAVASEPLPDALMVKLRALRDFHAHFTLLMYGPNGVGLEMAGAYSINIPSTTKGTGAFDAVSALTYNPSSPADVYRASRQQFYTTAPDQDDIVEHITAGPAVFGAFDASVLSSPRVLTYHADSGAGYLTGFPNVAVKVVRPDNTSTTYSAGAQVPYVESGWYVFSGIRVWLRCYGRNPNNGFQYTITKTVPPTSTGDIPSPKNILAGISGSDPTGTNGFYANGRPALAYLDDSGIAGAAAAYPYFTTAPNYAATQGASDYKNTPTFAVDPLAYSQPARTFALSNSTGAPVPTPILGPTLVFSDTPLWGAGTAVLSDLRGMGIPLNRMAAGGEVTSPLRDAVVVDAGATNGNYEALALYPAYAHGTLSPDETGGFVYAGDGTYDPGAVTYLLGGVLNNTAALNFGTAPTGGGGGSATVTGITAAPTAATVAGGSTTTVVVAVQGTNSPPQTFTSTKISGAGSANGAALSMPAANYSTQVGVFRFRPTLDSANHYVDVTLTVAALAIPPDTGVIDAAAVAGARKVAFQGSKRVVTFPGNKREVKF